LRVLGEEGEGEEWLKKLDETRSIRGGDEREERAMGKREWVNGGVRGGMRGGRAMKE